MKKERLQTIIGTALFTALICVATLALPISYGAAYLNPGDGVVLLAAWLLGPWYGALAAGLGSMTADFLAGYAIYAPATLVIKGLMAVFAALLYRGLPKRVGAVLGAAAAELWMVTGYFLFALLLTGSSGAAAASVPGNLLQGLVGLLLGALLLQMIKRLKK